MVIINTIDANTFSIDGEVFPTIYQPLTSDTDSVAIYNVYDTKLQILPSTLYSQITLDSVVYGTKALLIAALIPVIYKPASGGGGTIAWGDITSGLITSQTDLQAELDAKADTVHTHTTAQITNLSAYTGLDSRYYTKSLGDLRYAPIVHTHPYTDVVGFTDYIYDANSIQREILSTGISDGGALTINVDTTKFDIAAGVGFIVDHTVHPSVVTKVEWSAFTAQTVTNLATSFATDIAINAAGAIVQQDSYTTEELRSLIFLGGLSHLNQTNIDRTFSINIMSDGIGSNVYELTKAIGDINTSGNVFFPNATGNLTINKTSGTTFSYGRNNAVDKLNPNLATQATQTICPLLLVYGDGSGNGVFSALTNDIDPTQYDNGSGTLQAVSGAKWTIQRILMFSNSGQVAVQYGSAEYTNKSDAITNAALAGFDSLTGIKTAIVRGYIIVKNTATDLTSSDAEFVTADRFGGVSSRDAGATGTTAWGSITGTLSSQTDLQSALDAKVNLAGDSMTGILNVAANVNADNGFITSKATAHTHRTILGNSATVRNYLVGGSSTASTSVLDTYLRIRSIADGDLTFQENGLAHKIWHEGNLTPADYVLKAGDVMTGDLTVNAQLLIPNATVNNWAFRADTNDVNYSGLWFTAAGDGMLILRDSLGANTQLTYNATINGLNATGNINSEGSYYYGDSKAIVQFSDVWLRLNPSGSFTNGIYCGSSIVRTDGSLQVGASGSMFHATTAGVVSSAISMTSVDVIGTTSLTAGNSGVQNGTITLAKNDTGGVALAYEDDYYRWRRGGGGSIAGFRWDNFDSQVMRLASSGSVLTLGTDVATTGAVHAGDFIAGNQILNYGVSRWSVSEADTAHQRCDARDDATTQSRLHWYGVDSLGAVKNIREAWYDGNNYLYLDYENDELLFSTSVSASTSPLTFKIQSKVDANFIVEADSDNSTETDNPTIQMWQDGAAVKAIWGIESSASTAFTGTADNSPYFNTLAGTQWVFGTAGTKKFAIEPNGVTSAGYVAGTRIVAGYDSAVAGSVNASGWFRSTGSTGWFNATYGGGIYMTESTTVRVYATKKFQVDNDIYIAGANAGITRGGSTARGYLIGSYNADGNIATATGCIYTMGTSFKPAATTLGNMYGVGYSYGSASFLNSTDLGTTPSNEWGFYVAADGNARFFVSGTSGKSWQKSVSYASNFQLNSDRRLKTKIKDYKPTGLGVKWKTFELKNEAGIYRVGVIAQDLLKIAPQFVDQSDPKSLTVKSIDLANACIAELTQENKELRHRMDRLEKMFKISKN